MPNFTVWVKNPYPFRWEEMQAIEEALQKTYSGKCYCFKEWPVQFVTLEGVTLTTAKQVASTLIFAHRQAISRDRRYGQVTLEDRVEVEARNSVDGRPEWAREG